jgi:hypothetical protein
MTRQEAKRGNNMSFTEICIYQVKPQKVEEFEALMPVEKCILVPHDKYLGEEIF